jgi:type II secretory pathway pseudopilin PulG
MLGLMKCDKQPVTIKYQRGVTLIGLIFSIAVLSGVAMLAMKIIPLFVEFDSIKKAMILARDGSASPAQVRGVFDRQVLAGYITSVKGADLEVVKQNGELVVSVAYDKKIPLIGPASLLLEFSNTTAK